MSWNYRVVKHKDKSDEEWYGIHEVYYDKKDKPDMISEDPIDARGMTLDELKSDLEMMLRAFDKPVVVYEDFLKEIMGEFPDCHGFRAGNLITFDGGVSWRKWEDVEKEMMDKFHVTD
jgi:hypothetical protein